MKITKELQKQFEAKAKELATAFNPYIQQSIPYAIGGEPRYLWREKSYTREQIDEEYVQTAIKHITSGYKERMTGYYDKYYRYTFSDNGAAYDAGCQMATQNPKCKKECTFIEIAECNR
jgi:hypothetical protein